MVKPTRFGRYILLDRIGVGGMAEVFRAVMPGPEGFKRTLVVKRILTQLCQSPTFVDMFVREARIGALLNHPNIAQVYDFGNVDGEYFLAMEYIRGGDILALMRRLRDVKQAFPVPVAVFVGHQVACGLAYAHELRGAEGAPMNLIHRDVTPSNIMCLRTGGVKLLDFGIAKTAEESGVETTEKGSFRGKLAYMAPERVRGEAFDGRSDIYSLGVVLWELLTGRRLFRGGNDVETFKNVLEMEVAPPSGLRPDVPASLDRVVMRALARDPGERYPTAQALVDELEPILTETKYQSRMISDLLGGLYGTGVHSSQIALACITPDLLASCTEPPSATSRTPVLAPTEPATPPGQSTALAFAPTSTVARPRRVPLRWGAAVGAAALAAAIALIATRDGNGSSHAATTTYVPTPTTGLSRDVLAPSATHIPAAPTANVAAVAETDPTAPGGETAGPAAEGGSRTTTAAERATRPDAAKAVATSKPRPAPAPSRAPAAARPRPIDNAIVRGHSIDPFAEAAQRAGRR